MVLDGVRRAPSTGWWTAVEDCFRGRRSLGLGVELEQTSGRKVEALTGQ